MKIGIVIGLFFLCTCSYGQFKLGIYAGYSSFDMDDLKSSQETFIKTFQQNFLQNSPVKPQVVTSFPPFVGYRIEGVYSVSDRLSVGVQGGLNSTAGRVDYQDYSGLIRFDQNVIGISVGAVVSYRVNSSNKWPVEALFLSSFLRSQIEFRSVLIINDSQQEAELDFRSSNLALQPSFRVNRNISNSFSVFAQVGYELNVAGEVHLKGDRDAVLKNEVGQPVAVQWDGVRAGIGATFRFTVNSKSKSSNEVVTK